MGATTGSLLRQWVAKVVGAYSAKVTWPLISMKLDDQLAYAKVGATLYSVGCQVCLNRTLAAAASTTCPGHVNVLGICACAFKGKPAQLLCDDGNSTLAV